MQAFIKRHLELHAKRNRAYVVEDGKVFRPFSRLCKPLGPIAFDYSISRQGARRVMKALNVLGVLCTDGFRQAESQEWYAVISDRPLSLSEMSSKQRQHVRRGLRECEVRRLDPDYIVREGYEVFARAFERYRPPVRPPWSEAQFRQYVASAKGYDDIVHFWGAFRDKRLIALRMVDVYGKIEATCHMTKLHPDYLKAYPFYAMVHQMNEYYLKQEGMQYVNDGWRSMSHDTSIQSLLIDGFGFRKAYSNLHVHWGGRLSLWLKATFPLRNQIGRLNKPLASLYTTEQIRRACIPRGA